MMDLWKSLHGMVVVELTSAAPGEALQAVNGHLIPVYEVEYVSELSVRFAVHRKDCRKLLALCEKRGETVEIYRRTGIYWTLKGLRKRPVLWVGLALIVWLMLYLPTRILFVEVEGNLSLPARQVLAAAEECGINFWASRKEVRSEKVKNALLEALPELQWAGVNTYGCKAVISVRERTEIAQEEKEEGIGSIVAVRDGVIDSITVTRGRGLCRTGQAVREGQILISGYTDCGICIRATGAEGEVYAQTSRQISAITPAEYGTRTDVAGKKRKFSVLIGKNRINLWKDSGIWEATCGRMYEEYYITLPGGFQLPFAFAVETYTMYESETLEVSQTYAEAVLPDFAEMCLIRQMVAGQILNKDCVIGLEDGVYRLTGSYLCREMIGRVQWEQIGE